MGEIEVRAKPVKLSDLGTAIVDVTVIMAAYEREVTLPLMTLTYHKWMELGYEVPDPPKKTRVVNGQKVPNEDDPDYRREKEEAEHDRNLRRLAYAMNEAGNDVGSGNLEAKAERIGDEIDAGIATALIQWLEGAARKGAAMPKSIADQFRRRPLPFADGAGAAQAGQDASGVERPADGGQGRGAGAADPRREDAERSEGVGDDDESAAGRAERSERADD